MVELFLNADAACNEVCISFMSSWVHAGCSCRVFGRMKLMLCWSTDKSVFKGLTATMSSFISYRMDFFVNDLKLHFNITRDTNIYFSNTFLSSCFPTIFDRSSIYWKRQEIPSCLKWIWQRLFSAEGTSMGSDTGSQETIDSQGTESGPATIQHLGPVPHHFPEY